MVYSPLPNCLPSPAVNGQLDATNRPWPRRTPCPGIVVLLCIRTGNRGLRCRRRSGPTANWAIPLPGQAAPEKDRCATSRIERTCADICRKPCKRWLEDAIGRVVAELGNANRKTRGGVDGMTVVGWVAVWLSHAVGMNVRTRRTRQGNEAAETVYTWATMAPSLGHHGMMDRMHKSTCRRVRLASLPCLHGSVARAPSIRYRR